MPHISHICGKYWEISNPRDIEKVVISLTKCFDNLNLYIEDVHLTDERNKILKMISALKSTVTIDPATTCKSPVSFHIPLIQENIQPIITAINSEVGFFCGHIHAYDKVGMVMNWFDVSDNIITFDLRIDENVIQKFSMLCNSQYFQSE